MYLLPPSLEFTRVKNRWVGNSIVEYLKSWMRQKELKEWKVVSCMTILDLYLAINSLLCGKSCSTFIPMFLSNQIHDHSLSLTGFHSFKKREENGEFGHQE